MTTQRQLKAINSMLVIHSDAIESGTKYHGMFESNGYYYIVNGSIMFRFPQPLDGVNLIQNPNEHDVDKMFDGVIDTASKTKEQPSKNDIAEWCKNIKANNLRPQYEGRIHIGENGYDPTLLKLIYDIFPSKNDCTMYEGKIQFVNFAVYCLLISNEDYSANAILLPLKEQN